MNEILQFISDLWNVITQMLLGGLAIYLLVTLVRWLKRTLKRLGS